MIKLANKLMEDELTSMIKSKPVDELTIEDLKHGPIWEWAIGSEGEEEQDETWVQPAETANVSTKAKCRSGET